MATNQILQEARRLHSVSDSLNKLATVHASDAEALSILAGTVRHSATLLEVLVTIRLRPDPGSDTPGLDKASN
jgi:hypothetical protein